MRKLSRIGATALAIALSVTFLTPTTALAAKEKNYNSRRTVYLEKNVRTNTTYDNDLITVDVKNLGEFKDEEAAEAAFKAAGYSEEAGYYIDSANKAGNHIYVIQHKQYKNEITGATSIKKDDVVEKATKEDRFTKTIYIPKGEVTLVTARLINGDTTVKKVKTSKKSVITAELDKNNTYVYETNENADVEKDEAGNYFYYTTLGNKVYIPKNEYGYYDSKSAEYKNSNGSAASIGILVTAKKAGKAKLSFDIYNKAGVKTGTASVQVIVKSDFDVFKTFTYGGKSLILKTFGQTNYIDNGKVVGAHDNGYTDKAKGKLVIKANPGYKVVKIEIGKLTSKSYSGNAESYDGTTYNSDSDYSSATESGKSTIHPVDLNGDGDYMDTVYGIDEQGGNIYTFTKFKSGKTLKLSKVGESGESAYTYNAKENKYWSNKNANDELISAKSNEKGQEYLAPTVIRVTYYDMANKSYHVSERILWTDAKVKGAKKSK